MECIHGKMDGHIKDILIMIIATVKANYLIPKEYYHTQVNGQMEIKWAELNLNYNHIKKNKIICIILKMFNYNKHKKINMVI